MKYFIKILSLLTLFVPVFAFAQYQPLVGIPGVGTNTQDFDAYLQAIYATSISLAALLAVIKIVIAGVKWMTTDITNTKSDAKKDIEGAILGLVVILGAVLILYIINPNIGTVDLALNGVPEPPPQVVRPPSSLEDRINSCETSSVCEISTCETTYDCESAAAQCRDVLNGAPDQITESTILCVRAGSGSQVEEETDIAQDAIRNFFNENSEDYLGLLTIYSVNQRDYRENRDLSPSEIARNVEVWATECTADSGEFIELEDVQREVYVRFCAQEA